MKIINSVEMDEIIGSIFEKDVFFQKQNDPSFLIGKESFFKWWIEAGKYSYPYLLKNIYKKLFNYKLLIGDNFDKDGNLISVLTSIEDTFFYNYSLKFPKFLDEILNQREDVRAYLKYNGDLDIWWKKYGSKEYQNFIDKINNFFNLEFINFYPGVELKLKNSVNKALYDRGLPLIFEYTGRKDIASLIISILEQKIEHNFIALAKDADIDSSAENFVQYLIYEQREDLRKIYEYGGNDFKYWWIEHGYSNYKFLIDLVKDNIRNKNFDLTNLNIINCPKANIVNLIGIHDEISGLSIDAFNFNESLNCLGKKVNKIYFKNGNMNGDLNKLNNNLSLFVLPPYATLDFACKFGDFLNSESIAYLPWEFCKVDERIWNYLPKLKEIWTTSQFTKKAFENSKIACKVSPLVIEYKDYIVDNEQLKNNDENFYFLNVFDGNSSLNRKNPMAVIKAFNIVFKILGKKIFLIIKMHNVNEENFNYLKSICENDNIIFINEGYGCKKYLDLLNSVDAVVSAHRSEGFGRVMAEAMYFKKPVIASNYSGNLDYMDNENSYLVGGKLIEVNPYEYQSIFSSKGYYWFDIDVNELADSMVKCFNSDNNKKLDIAYNKIIKKYSQSKFKEFLELNI